MAAAGVPGARAGPPRLRWGRSQRPGQGRAGVAGPHSPGSGPGRSAAATARDAQPGPRCADRAGNSAAAAAATADSPAWAAAAERSQTQRPAAGFIDQQAPPPTPDTPLQLRTPRAARAELEGRYGSSRRRVRAPARCGARAGEEAGGGFGPWVHEELPESCGALRDPDPGQSRALLSGNPCRVPAGAGIHSHP